MDTEATIFSDVENATVAFTRQGGQGVLVTGNLILTAAHCVDFALTGGMVLGDHYVEGIRTKTGVNLKVSPRAVEPLSDIAALGPLDDQECPNEADGFEWFCELTKPIPLFTGTLAFRESINVYVFTHKGTWLKGKVTQYSTETFHRVCLETEEPIEGGTSGSPVINEAGELVVIVSNSGNDPAGPTGGYVGIEGAPRPNLTLPRWICRQIESA